MPKTIPGFALHPAACIDQARTERSSRIANAALLYEYGRHEKAAGAVATR